MVGRHTIPGSARGLTEHTGFCDFCSDNLRARKLESINVQPGGRGVAPAHAVIGSTILSDRRAGCEVRRERESLSQRPGLGFLDLRVE